MKKVILCVSLFLTACSAISPGINRGPSTSGQNSVKIIPINANLIAEQNAEPPVLQYIPSKTLDNYQYIVGPNDVLGVTVWDHPELNNPTGGTASFQQLGFTVTTNGDIYYPYVGNIHVAGKTVSQVRELLSQQLATYIRDPAVNVNVLNYNNQRVMVTGQIMKPDIIDLNNLPTTPLSAITLSGGTNSQGDLRHVSLKRKGETYELNLLDQPYAGFSSKIALQGGDILDVPNFNDRKVFVFGEVGNAKSVVMNTSSLSLSDALSQAGSLDQKTSNPELIFVIRRVNNALTAYQLDASTPAALVLASEFKLKNQDIIYVGTYKLTNWNRFISQLVPTTSVTDRIVTRSTT